MATPADCSKYYQRHRERLLQQQRDRYARPEVKARHKKSVWRYMLRTKYGLTPEQHDAMVKAQGGLCAICRSEFGRNGPRVDHNHETGVVRGLLCHPCNVSIGLLRESPETLWRAAEYLAQHTPLLKRAG